MLFGVGLLLGEGRVSSLACELWLTIGTERFWQISAGPQLSSLGRIFRCDHDIGPH